MFVLRCFSVLLGMDSKVWGERVYKNILKSALMR